MLTESVWEAFSFSPPYRYLALFTTREIRDISARIFWVHSIPRARKYPKKTLGWEISMYVSLVVRIAIVSCLWHWRFHGVREERSGGPEDIIDGVVDTDEVATHHSSNLIRVMSSWGGVHYSSISDWKKTKKNWAGKSSWLYRTYTYVKSGIPLKTSNVAAYLIRHLHIWKHATRFKRWSNSTIS